MPSVLLLCEYPTLNGGERSMLATFDGLRKAGFTPTVMAPPEGPLADVLASQGVELISFQCRATDGTRRPQDRLREELADMLRRRRPDLLHANSLAMGRLSGPVAAELRQPSIAHLRDIVGLSARAVADVNCHSRLLAVSRAVRDFHAAGGIDAQKIHVLHNGIDLDEFCPRPPTGYLHQELGLPPETPLVGCIGQIGLRKGQDVLLGAGAQIVAKQPHVHYLLVGQRNSSKEESRQFERDLQRAASESLAGRVHFLGRRTDANRLYGELTLLVHPARQEPLGRVLLEAAASGVPVVATAVGGTPEIFPPETNAARLVPPDDADALAWAMCELLDNQELRGRMAGAARKRAEEAFDIRSAATNLMRHYEAVIG